MRLFRSSKKSVREDTETQQRATLSSSGADVTVLGNRRGMVARKVDEAPSRPSGSPLRNTESTLAKLARRLSLTTGGKRRSVTSLQHQRGPLSLKDISMASGTSSDKVQEEPKSEVPAEPVKEEIVIPKEVVIPSRSVSEEEERLKLVKDLGEETAEIVRKVAHEFEPPVLDSETVLDVSKMSISTMKFCGRSAPPVSLALYISRILRNINNALDESTDENNEENEANKTNMNHVDSVGVRCLLIAVIYIQRMKERQPEFEINVLNVHRLFFVAMTDALKVNEDEHPDNKYMALVGGVDTTQLNTLEAAFCTGNDFKFIVEMAELESMYHKYYKRTHVLVPPPNQSKYPVRRVSWESKA